MGTISRKVGPGVRAICSLTTGQDFAARSEIRRSRCRIMLRLGGEPSVLDLCVRAVVAAFLFLMPAAGTVLVLDRAPLPGRALLLRRPLRSGVGRLACTKGLRKDVSNLIGPSAIVLDNSISDMAHGRKPSSCCVRPDAPEAGRSAPSGGFVGVLERF